MEKKTNTTKILIWIIGGLTITVAIAGLILILTLRKPTPAVPDFHSMDSRTAQKWFEKMKIDNERFNIKHEYSETVKKGDLISQSVQAGDKLTENIIITYSWGRDPEKEITIDLSLIGKNKKEAQEWALNQGIDITKIEVLPEETEDIDDNLVTRFEPETTVKRNGNLTIYYSIKKVDPNAPKDVMIPDFTKYNRTTAKNYCSSNNLKCSFQEVSNDKYAAGKIFDQSIRAEEIVKEGTSVVIKISTGKSVEMLNLLGKTKNEISKWADGNGLIVKYSNEYNRETEKGLAIYQEPKNGITVKEGDTIKITLSLGSDFIEKNSYAGKPVSDLTSRIDEINKEYDSKIKANESGSRYSNSVAKDYIISNDEEFTLTKDISYIKSLGKFTEVKSASDFNGKSKSSVETEIKEANDKNAEMTLSIVDGEATEDSSKVGKTYDCSYSENTLKCKVYIQKNIDKTFTMKEITSNPCGSESTCKIDFENSDGYKGKVTVKIETSTEWGGVAGEIKSVTPSVNSKINENTIILITLYKGPEPEEKMITLDASILGFSEQPGGDPEAVKNSVREALKALGFTNYEVVDSNAVGKGLIDYENSTTVGLQYKKDDKIIIKVGITD